MPQKERYLVRRFFAARLLIGAASLIMGSNFVLGATRTVTNLNDSGPGSLRDTIAAAVAGDTIQFSVTGTITLTSDQLTVNKNLTITGPGPGSLTIIFGGFGRAFWIPSGTVNLSGLTIRDCNENYGSALLIYAGATLTVTNCVFQGNDAHYNASSFDPYPGVVENLGTLTLNDCTLLANKGRTGGTYTVKCQPGSSLTVQRCTFESNWVSAIRSESPLTITNSTFYKNGIEAVGGATVTSCTFAKSGIFIGHTNSLTIRNTILAEGSFDTLYNPTIISQGYNLSDDDGGGYLTGPGDQINTDPKLDFYGVVYNGGYTRTVALRSGSPAIDKGKAFGLTTDQRGQPRTIDNPESGPAPGGDGTDIGAYEAPTDALQAEKDVAVNTLADHDDGICGVGDCTLREAVSRANFAGPNNLGYLKITFAPTLTGTLTLDRTLGELAITYGMWIVGPGARVLAVSGGGYIRIFNIGSSASPQISGLTIQQGWQAAGNVGASNQGGAILNQGGLILEDCAFSNNYAAGVSAGTTGAGGSGRGGAIYNAAGTLTLRRCLFSNGASSGNLTVGGAGASNITPGARGAAGGAAQGGAIYNAAGAHLIGENCTFYGNGASGGGGGNGGSGGTGGSGAEGAGGAIYSVGEMSLTGCTVSGNYASGGAGGTTNRNTGTDGRPGRSIGGIASDTGASSTMADTLCAANSGSGPGAQIPDLQGAFVSLGFNLIGASDDSTGFNQASDMKGTKAAPINPMLGSLANNGGPTNTMSPSTGSPAIDKGKRFTLTNDQRGVARPVNDPAIPDAAGGDGSDIGAMEYLPDGPQPGPTFVVTTVDDHDDGGCRYVDCTLREAINAANAAAGPNAITFAPTVYGTITLGSALPDITTDVQLIGTSTFFGSTVTVSGANTYRVFTFLSGTSEVSGLTIRDGTNLGFVLASVSGGGIYNEATLKLTECLLAKNKAQGGSAVTNGSGGSGRGGAIFNKGTLTVERCTIQDSVAQGGSGASRGTGAAGSGGSGSGGAIFNDLAAVLTLIDCTLAQNSGNGGNGGNGGSSGGNGGAGQGGIFNQGTLAMTSCTLSLNNGRGGSGGTGTTAGTGGSGCGGICQSAANGSSTVTNSIVAGNLASGNGTALDISGAFLSTGHNFIGTGATGSGFNQQGDQVGGVSGQPAISARLKSLDRPFGRVPVMPIGLDSPALDKGRRAGLTWDELGMPRTVDSPVSVNAAGGDGTDIGAFEFNPSKVDAVNSEDETYSDTDGMYDEYEIFFGFNPYDPSDGDQDFDGDGLTNDEEYLVGTNPRDGASVLRILRVDYLGQSALVRFGQVIPFWPYRLEYKNELSDSQWLLLPASNNSDYVYFPLAGEGEIVDPTISGRPRRFYRVRSPF